MEIVDSQRVNSAFQSLGYLIDVYEDCVVLRARDFGVVSGNAMINPEWVPIATYKIDTTIQSIKENTFVDTSGAITTG